MFNKYIKDAVEVQTIQGFFPWSEIDSYAAKFLDGFWPVDLDRFGSTGLVCLTSALHF